MSPARTVKPVSVKKTTVAANKIEQLLAIKNEESKAAAASRKKLAGQPAIVKQKTKSNTDKDIKKMEMALSAMKRKRATERTKEQAAKKIAAEVAKKSTPKRVTKKTLLKLKAKNDYLKKVTETIPDEVLPFNGAVSASVASIGRLCDAAGIRSKKTGVYDVIKDNLKEMTMRIFEHTILFTQNRSSKNTILLRDLEYGLKSLGVVCHFSNYGKVRVMRSYGTSLRLSSSGDKKGDKESTTTENNSTEGDEAEELMESLETSTEQLEEEEDEMDEHSDDDDGVDTTTTATSTTGDGSSDKTDSGKKKHRRNHNVLLMRRIHYTEKQIEKGRLIFDKARFKSIVRDCLNEIVAKKNAIFGQFKGANFRISKNALTLAQFCVERSMIILLKNANMSVAHNGRVTIDGSDILMAVNLMKSTREIVPLLC